ncbi:TetR/AcrR family transcriptional regulator [Sinimarinibacterium flocculans]|uniref:TetR/AcrR family transcriptional regulator n=1 Tax=Sinimarinibacterium flocculans TaxID=985250 RepID=UPI003515ECFD
MKQDKVSADCNQQGGLRVRDRIFNTARELFYRQGIRAVGVDAIASEAGTNKMSFYRSFASKDDLVAECLRAQVAESWTRWDAALAPHEGDARRQIEAVFEMFLAKACSENACGCPLSNAAVELREESHPAREVIREHKTEMRNRLRTLAKQAGAADADALGDALLLLLEGSTATRLVFDGRNGPVGNALAAARALLDACLPPVKAPRKSLGKSPGKSSGRRAGA